MELRLSRKETFITSLIILLILAWTLANVTSAYFWISEGETWMEKEPIEQEFEEGGGSSLSLHVPEYIKYVFVGVLLGGAVIALLSRSKKELKKSWMYVFGFLVLGLSIVFLYFMMELFTKIGGLFDWVPIPDISSEEITAPLFEVGGSNTLGGLIIIVLSLILALFFYRMYKSSADEETDEKEDISTTAEKAIRELHQGKDVRDVIIRNYQKMCIFLEEEGVPQEVSYTPRELEKKAIERLQLEESTIDEMTRLFEKAKYSDHPLKEAHRERTIRNFQKIKEELEAG
ncbi:MAG: DUF4129 domain-containing protein [Candidatus Aenigmatarchaeota archaeon]